MYYYINIVSVNIVVSVYICFKYSIVCVFQQGLCEAEVMLSLAEWGCQSSNLPHDLWFF